MLPEGCPVSHDFAPLSESYLNNPFPLFSRLREEAPVHYVPELGLYIVTRYDDIDEVLRDRETFSASNAIAPFAPIVPEALSIIASGVPRRPTTVDADPPRHPRMRHAASRCLSRRRWASVEPSIRIHAEEAVGRLLQKPVADLGEDLVFPVAKLAGFALIGLPPSDVALMGCWCGTRVRLTFGQLPPGDQVEAARSLVEFWNYCRDFVVHRNTHRADDMTSDFLALVDEGVDDLEIEDVIAMVYNFILASFESTASAILNGLARLLREREVWDQLCADSSLIPGAVEELLRIDGPMMTHRRLAKTDAQIGGVPIPAGSTVMLLFGAGNRDPRRFEGAERLDIRRGNASEHLAFGKHWHSCLGAPLARFEYQLILEQLTTRAPHMRLAPGQVTYVPIVHLRSPEGLLVTPDGRGAPAGPTPVPEAAFERPARDLARGRAGPARQGRPSGAGDVGERSR